MPHAQVPHEKEACKISKLFMKKLRRNFAHKVLVQDITIPEQIPKVPCTTKDHNKETCKVSKRLMKFCKRSCVHKVHTQMVSDAEKVLFALRKE